MPLTDARELTEQWVATWVELRGLRLEQVDGYPLVHVASASRRTELVCLDPGVDRFLQLLRHVGGDSEGMLTVAAPDISSYLAAPLPSDVRIDRDDESLMSTRLVDRQPISLPPELHVRWEVGATSTTCTLEDGHRVAAVGTVGVLDRVATFDRIETTPAFRRRGLGRYLMTALTNHAVERGATHGVLAASADGRLLYAALGWTTRLSLMSVMGV